MSKPAFVALGDIHLSRLIWTKQQRIEGDSFLGFSGFLDQAIKLQVPAVIVGDLFDTANPDSSLVEFFRHEMDRCREHGVEVYCIQGNHDKRKIPWYEAASAYPVHIGSGELLKIAGLTCCGFDYGLRDEIEARLAELSGAPEKPQVLFLHQAVKQALKFEGAWNCDLDWVPPGIPLVIMGDIHKEMEFTTQSGARAYYTGASHARDIEQLGSKSCLLVYQDLTCVRIPIPYRNMKRFYCTTGVDQETLRNSCLEFVGQPSGLPPVLFLTHTPEMSQAVDTLAGEAQRIRPDLILVIDEITKLMSDQIELKAQAPRDSVPTRREILGRVLDPKDLVSFQLADDLLDPSNNIQDTIRSTRDRFIAGRHSRVASLPPGNP